MIMNFTDTEKLLYHYTSMGTAKDLILKSGKLRMGNYNRTNDPKESKVWEFNVGSSGASDLMNYTGAKMTKLSNQLSDTLKERCRILCFSMDIAPLSGVHLDDIHRRGFAFSRMWAQYGDAHKGVCLVFDKQKLERQLKLVLEQSHSIAYFGAKITYKDRSIAPKFDEVDYTIYADFLEEHGFERYWRWHLQNFYPRLFFEKLQDWRDEREFRYVAFVEPDREVYVEYADALVGVIFGDAASDDDVDRAIEMLLPTSVELMGLKWKNCSPWYDFGSLKYSRQMRNSPWFQNKKKTPPASIQSGKVSA